MTDLDRRTVLSLGLAAAGTLAAGLPREARAQAVAPPVSKPSAAAASKIRPAWLDVAVSDMRTPSGGFAANDDVLLHRTLASKSSQATQAVLVMGRFGTKAAFTSANPDYRKELSWVSPTEPIRQLEAWTRLTLWDQVYLSEKYGPMHAPGYTGNSRVRTWGYELWTRSKAGAWTMHYRTDGKNGEAVRPTFKGGATRERHGWDFRKETDGSTSVRPMPPYGFDTTGSYWVPHGYLPAPTVDPHDIDAVLVLCQSQLVLHDPKGNDDRAHARFLLAVGADWLPPAGVKVSLFPSVGSGRHKFVTVEPQLHVMHTMSEAELRASPPPR